MLCGLDENKATEPDPIECTVRRAKDARVKFNAGALARSNLQTLPPDLPP